MEQETLVSELRNRVGDPDISERTINQVAQSALPMFADDSKITDDLWNFAVTTVKSAVGQERAARKDWITKQQETLAESDKKAREQWQKDFEAKWAKDHQSTPPTTPPADNKPDDKGGDEDKVAKAVSEALKGYNTKLFGEDGKSGLIGAQLAATSEFIKQSNAKAKEARIESMRKELKDYLVGKKASREPVINLAIKEMNLDDDTDIDKAKIEVEKSYEAKFKEFYGDGGKPFGGESAGGGEANPDEDVKKFLESRAKEREERQKRIDEMKKSFV